MKIELNLNEEIFEKCSFAYTVFCEFVDYEKDNMCREEQDEFKKSFLFLLLRDSATCTESDFLVTDFVKWLS